MEYSRVLSLFHFSTRSCSEDVHSIRRGKKTKKQVSFAERTIMKKTNKRSSFFLHAETPPYAFRISFRFFFFFFGRGGGTSSRHIRKLTNKQPRSLNLEYDKCCTATTDCWIKTLRLFIRHQTDENTVTKQNKKNSDSCCYIHHTHKDVPPGCLLYALR